MSRNLHILDICNFMFWWNASEKITNHTFSTSQIFGDVEKYWISWFVYFAGIAVTDRFVSRPIIDALQQ